MEAEVDGMPPIDIWRWGLQNNVGMLRSMEPAYVRAALLPSKKAVVTEHGLRVGGLYYSFPSGDLSRFGAVKKSGVETLKCLYDPFVVDHVYLIRRNKEEVEECALMTKCDAHAGLSWSEYDKWSEEHAERRTGSRAATIERQNNVDAITDRELSDAKAKQGGGSPSSTNVREAQADQQKLDRDRARQQAAAMRGARTAPVEQPNKPMSNFAKNGCATIQQALK